MLANSTEKRGVKELLLQYGFHPSIKLGQNFLIDRSIIKKFLETANIGPGDVVLEIGPGLGNLTQEIAKEVKKVIAVEKDPRLCEILKETLKDSGNVEIVQGDILKIPNTKYKIQNTKYKVVANLPFYLTSPVIRKFLESKNPPKHMTLIVQKEVAQRIAAQPPDMNLLAVLVQFYAKPEIVSFISKKSFWPQPKVDSAILRITPICTDEKTDKHRFFEIVRAGFSQPRKQLANNLAKKLRLGDEDKSSSSPFANARVSKEEVADWLRKNEIQPSQRAETLKIKDWIALTMDIGNIGVRNSGDKGY